jgi:hypothetical protein
MESTMAEKYANFLSRREIASAGQKSFGGSFCSRRLKNRPGKGVLFVVRGGGASFNHLIGRHA